MTSKRKLGDWIDAFYEFTANRPTPSLFRKWAAIGTIAGALERKVWVRTLGSDLYPNLYILLVSGPGMGKTVMTDEVGWFWGHTKDHYLAPSAMSRASLADALREAERRKILPSGNILSFNSLLVAINELSTLIPMYDNDFMGTLTDLWDGKRYGEKKRSKDLNYVLERPQLNLFSGTTPSYLNGIMPEGAWDQGFISRVIMVYSGESTLKDLFAEEITDTKKREELSYDLNIIGNELVGKMNFTQEAMNAITEWYMKKGPPIPDHPKLIWYNTRRTAHLLKLCQVASASRGADLWITLEDYQRALGWLLEAEVYMPDIFRSMTQGGDSRAIEDCWHYCYQLYVREKKLVPEARLWNFLSQRVPSHNIERVIKAMVTSGLLEKVLNEYKPLVKH